MSTADDGYFYLDQVGYEALIVDAIQELRAEKDMEIELLKSIQVQQGNQMIQLQTENLMLKAELERFEQRMIKLVNK